MRYRFRMENEAGLLDAKEVEVPETPDRGDVIAGELADWIRTLPVYEGDVFKVETCQ